MVNDEALTPLTAALKVMDWNRLHVASIMTLSHFWNGRMFYRMEVAPVSYRAVVNTSINDRAG